MSGNIAYNQIRAAHRSGDAIKLGTVDGALVNGNLLKADADGNIIDAGVSSGAIGSFDSGNAPTTGWTFDNQDSATSVLISGIAGIKKFGVGTANAYTFLYRAAPSAPYTILIRLTAFYKDSFGGSGNQNGWAIGWRDSGGKYVVYQAGTSANVYVAMSKHSSANAPVGDYSLDQTSGYVSQLANGYDSQLWVQIEDDNTDLKVSLGKHPLAMYQFESRPRTDYLSSPTQVAIGVRGSGASMLVDVWDVTP